jgi:hypothetical protein
MGKSRAVMGNLPAYADPNLSRYLDFLWSARRDSNPRPSPWQKNRAMTMPDFATCAFATWRSVVGVSVDRKRPLSTVVARVACVFCAARTTDSCTTCTTRFGLLRALRQ